MICVTIDAGLKRLGIERCCILSGEERSHKTNFWRNCGLPTEIPTASSVTEKKSYLLESGQPAESGPISQPRYPDPREHDIGDRITRRIHNYGGFHVDYL